MLLYILIILFISSYIYGRPVVALLADDLKMKTSGVAPFYPESIKDLIEPHAGKNRLVVVPFRISNQEAVTTEKIPQFDFVSDKYRVIRTSSPGLRFDQFETRMTSEQIDNADLNQSVRLCYISEDNRTDKEKEENEVGEVIRNHPIYVNLTNYVTENGNPLISLKQAIPLVERLNAPEAKRRSNIRLVLGILALLGLVAIAIVIYVFASKSTAATTTTDIEAVDEPAELDDAIGVTENKEDTIDKVDPIKEDTV